MTRAARLACLAFLGCLPPFAALAADASHTPLLDYARAHLSKPRQRASAQPSRVRAAEHFLQQAHLPPPEACAHSLGARNFAQLHVTLASARSEEGDFAGAAQAYRHAHRCRPRDTDILAALGGALFDSRDFTGARAAADTGLAIDQRSINLNRLAGNLSFVAEDWANAIVRFRYVAASDQDRDQAAYGQLMLWLAQARAGIAHPEMAARTAGEGWPQPLVLYMRGQYTEAELIVPIEEDDAELADYERGDNPGFDQRLAEALFYVGEMRWARDEPAVARDYLAAQVNVRANYLVEHGLALAELVKLRQ